MFGTGLRNMSVLQAEDSGISLSDPRLYFYKLPYKQTLCASTWEFPYAILSRPMQDLYIPAVP